LSRLAGVRMTPVTADFGYTTTGDPSARPVAIWQLPPPDPQTGHADIAMVGIAP
jgi:hypothetical protein